MNWPSVRGLTSLGFAGDLELATFGFDSAGALLASPQATPRLSDESRVEPVLQRAACLDLLDCYTTPNIHTLANKRISQSLWQRACSDASDGFGLA